MLVNIDEIKSSGLERSWELAREELDRMVEGERAGYRSRGPALVQARLEKIGRRVRLTARTRADLTCPCGRCLETVSVAVPVDFELTLVPAEELEAGPAGEGAPASERARVAGSFAEEEVDEEPYSGKVLDLAPILREQILLALPAYPVCRESCRGLCPACGANLSDRDCGCDRHVPDPRWAALRNVKL